MTEHAEQVAIVNWFKGRYPHFRDCIIAIPNGTHLAGDKVVRFKKMAKLKAEGLKPGASDLFIAVPGIKCGMWLEMKAKGKTYCSVSQAQRDHLELMRKLGYAAEWAAGFEAAKKIIEEYMNSETDK